MISAREVSFAGQDPAERATIDKHGWLHPGQLEDGTERPADPQIPRLMRAAVAAVCGPALTGAPPDHDGIFDECRELG
jgi:hypothetical protein